MTGRQIARDEASVSWLILCLMWGVMFAQAVFEPTPRGTGGSSHCGRSRPAPVPDPFVEMGAARAHVERVAPRAHHRRPTRDTRCRSGPGKRDQLCGTRRATSAVRSSPDQSAVVGAVRG